MFGDEPRRRARPRPHRAQHDGEPLGERIIVHGRVLDEDGRAGARHAGRDLAGQRRRPLPPRRRPAARAAGPELHRRRALASPTTRAASASSRSSRAPTRGATTTNAWRPAHIHFSLFGRAFTQRLVTQMYFPGDPLFESDPIFNSVRDERARQRMICAFDLERDRGRLGARRTASTSCCAADDPVRGAT